MNTNQEKTPNEKPKFTPKVTFKELLERNRTIRKYSKINPEEFPPEIRGKTPSECMEMGLEYYLMYKNFINQKKTEKVLLLDYIDVEKINDWCYLINTKNPETIVLVDKDSLYLGFDVVSIDDKLYALPKAARFMHLKKELEEDFTDLSVIAKKMNEFMEDPDLHDEVLRYIYFLNCNGKMSKWKDMEWQDIPLVCAIRAYDMWLEQGNPKIPFLENNDYELMRYTIAKYMNEEIVRAKEIVKNSRNN